MDEGTGLTPEAVKELRRATDLALRATKHTARAVGHSMAASVAAERHLWLNLTEIREKEKTFLMDAPISQSGLFGEAVSAVVDKFRCADPIHPHFHSGWQLGDAFIFPPLQPVHSPLASRMLGNTAVSLLQCTEPVPATRQPSTSLSAIPSKDAEGSPSQWRVPLLPGFLDTQSQVCLPLHDTLIPLSHFLHEWERLPGVSLWVLRTI